MSIKNILVPLSGIPSDLVVAGTALLVARDFGSQIDGVFAHGTAAVVESYMLAELDETMHQEILQSAKAHGERKEIEVRKNFEEILGLVKALPAGNVTALLEVTDGSEVDAIIERGGVYDLLVVARPEGGSHSASQEIAEAALFHTGRPVLLAPAEVPQSIGEKILIAWNKSPQAGRAVANTMPFLERAREALIFHVETRAKRGPSPGRLKQYLGLHGISAEIAEIAPDYRPVGEQVLDQAREFGADLIVMGAYSMSRLRERLLGGVTRHIFTQADIPVLMAR